MFAAEVGFFMAWQEVRHVGKALVILRCIIPGVLQCNSSCTV